MALYAKRRATDRALTDRDAELDPLAYHVAFGPPATHPSSGQLVVVPIEPRYARRLLPDAEPQLELLEPAPYGNAIRKAYLCRAPIRRLGPGDVLLFYRSGEGSREGAVGITTTGVVERTVVSSSAEEIAAEVGTRTVYSMVDIEQMCDGGEVLAILFRQDRVIESPVTLPELRARGALNGPPQSITAVREEAIQWLRQRIR